MGRGGVLLLLLLLLEYKLLPPLVAAVLIHDFAVEIATGDVITAISSSIFFQTHNTLSSSQEINTLFSSLLSLFFPTLLSLSLSLSLSQTHFLFFFWKFCDVAKLAMKI
jgi:hypothetical protein